MASRLITDLSPHAQQECTRHLENMKSHGINAFLTCTRRSFEEQTALYRIGRELPGKIVTKAKAGESAHNYGLAWDIAILVSGKLVWDLKHPDWQLAGHLGESIFGVEWFGNPKSKFREGAHFQIKNWSKYIH